MRGTRASQPWQLFGDAAVTQRGQLGEHMNTSSSRRALLGAIFAAALLGAAGSAIAAAGGAPRKARVFVKGGESIVPNAYLKLSFHFDAGTVPIRSGGTVTLTNLTTEGHTLSIVKASQVPHTIRQLQNCSACLAIDKAHGINPEGPPVEGPPPNLLVNAGGPGFDAPGDSVIIPPKGRGAPVSFKVTAKPGTVLNFICAFHPWMQGRFLVK